MKHTKFIEIELKEENLTMAGKFLFNELSAMKHSQASMNASTIMFEELFMGIIHQLGNETTTAKLSVENHFGEVTIKFRYEGERFQLEKLTQDEFSAEILKGYRDKLRTEYHQGMNIVSIKVRNSRRRNLLHYAHFFMFAVIIDFILDRVDPSAAAFAREYILRPTEKILIHAVLLISTPLAFFCLVKNCITLLEANRNRTNSTNIIKNIILQSLLAVVICIPFCLILRNFIANPYEEFYSVLDVTSPAEIAELDLVSFFFPSSLNEFFSLTKPFAFITLAILVAEAICNSEEHFEALRNAVNAVSALLCKLLNIVLTILPIAYFVSVIDEVLYDPVSTHFLCFALAVFCVLFFTALMMAIYSVQIKLAGGKTIDFLKKCFSGLKENILIGSSIDAVPYNIRFFSKALNIPMKDLNDKLPIMSQVSQAGNCLCFSFISMAFLFLCNIEYSFFNILIVVLLSFFLGIGSPGQQGGILAGAIIITSFLGLPLEGLMSTAIVWEVVLGPISTQINTFGDIVIVYIQNLGKQRNTPGASHA